MFLKNQQKVKRPIIGVIIISIFIIADVFVFYQSYTLVTKGIKTTGIVIDYVEKKDDDGISYTPVVKYEIQGGKVLTEESNGSQQKKPYKINETVNIFYDQNKPTRMAIDTFYELWMLPLSLLIPILVIAAMAFIKNYYIKRLEEKKQRLFTNGRPVRTKFVKFQKITNKKINKKSPFIITTKWLNPKNNITYYFNSEELFTHPEIYLKGRDTIMVYIDPQNPYNYIMDTRFIPDNI